jgi:hypothetical protein
MVLVLFHTGSDIMLISLPYFQSLDLNFSNVLIFSVSEMSSHRKEHHEDLAVLCPAGWVFPPAKYDRKIEK